VWLQFIVFPDFAEKAVWVATFQVHLMLHFSTKFNQTFTQMIP
jgi:hypothetical protein